MKRSKALEEIRKILAMNGKDNGYGELEEALLHTMESLDMLPPTVQGGSMNGWNRWEPEDEA
jgi:hypothetical protein